MHKIIMAGYGGQGMLLCGQVLAYAAMLDGYNVTWMPSYGPEMRGGAASCSVVISEKAVGSPVIQFADAVVAVSQPAFDKYQDSVSDGGIMVYNSSLVKISEKRDNIKYIGLDFSKMASELGNSKVANMIVLGSVNEALSCVKISAVHEAIREKFKGKKAAILDLNEKAVEAGAKIIREN